MAARPRRAGNLLRIGYSAVDTVYQEIKRLVQEYKMPLEEALCFGWIDGRMQRIDDASYRKYFAPRRAKSVWSDKNKALAVELEERGLMTDAGRRAMEAAKRNGCWDAKKAPDVTEDDTAALEALIAGHEPAASNFQAMSPSVRRTYTRAYFDAKTDAGREKRLAWMLDRLDRNLKPM